MKKKSPQMSEIERAFDGQQDIASTINRHRVYVNEALNGKRDFTETELKLIYEEMGRRRTA